MAKKSKKRQLDADSNGSEKIETKAHANNDAPKTKKFKTSSEKSEKQNELNVASKKSNLKNEDVSQKKELQINTKKLDANTSTTSTNIVQQKKLKKKNKKNKNKKEENLDGKTTPSDSTTDESMKSKRQEFFKQKRAEHKEKQKTKGIRTGPFTVLNTYSLTEMKKKIAEIESQETISKTAARRLRILKKKVQVQESEGDKKSENEQDGTCQKISKEHEKNKLQNTINKKIENITIDAKKSIDKKKKEKEIVKKLEKNLFVEDRVGNKVDDSANAINEKGNKLNVKKFNKKMDQLKKKNFDHFNLKNVKIATNDSDNEVDDSEDLNDSDSDEDEDEDEDEDQDDSKEDEDDSKEDEDEDDSKEDEDEDDSKEDTTEFDESINESNSNESDNEGENITQKVEKGKSKSDTNIKNAPKKSNQDPNKQKPKPTEKDPNKKQRYVLFVGNIAYDATTVDLKKHFLTKVDKVKDIRIPSKPGTNLPRGFAYVEVDNSEDYEKALSLHNTFINGRQIKVEYTTSGSKKGNRNPEVIHKNKKLHALRKEGKLAGSEKFSNKRSFRRNFKNNPKNDSAENEKFPHKRSFKTNFKNNSKGDFKKKFGKKESQ